MKDKLEAIKAKPWVAHLLRAQTRYGNRMGSQFAAAITYFSVLALVPIVMFAFSMLGMTLTVLRPDWLGTVKDEVTSLVGSGKFSALIDEYLENWRSVGIVGLLSLLYAGSGWVGNLRSAIRAQWRPEFEFDEKKKNFFVAILLNAGTLMVLLLGVGLTFALSVAGTAMSGTIAGWLHLTDSTAGRVLLRIGTIAVTVLCAWLLFLLLYWILPGEPAPIAARLKGALVAAVTLAALQVGAGALMGVFSQNKAAALFGPVIILMLVLNLFGQIALFVAAWIATTTQPAVAFHWNQADEPLRNQPDTDAAEGHWERADADHAAELEQQEAESAAAQAAKEGRPILPQVVGAPRPLRVEASRAEVAWRPVALDADGTHPSPDPAVLVPQDVAAKSVKVASVASYASGAATGVGLGALIAGLVARWARR